MDDPREIFVACAHGSYDNGKDSSDDGTICSSSDSLPNGVNIKTIAIPDSQKQPTHPMSLEDIPWYHAGLTRNSAEAILLTNGLEGSYLVRKSTGNPGQYSLSVRYSNSVKHFTMLYDGVTYSFGIAQFDTLQELLDHFSYLPVIGTETGGTVTLQYPYYSDIPEPHSYEKIERHAEGGIIFSSKMQPNCLPDYHIASKEGYLVKRGAVRKSWRKRWFTLRSNQLKYFKTRSSTKPIRTIDLETALDIQEEEIPGKSNCFLLQLPWRTFHFYASTAKEAADWVRILQWKLNYYKERSDAKLPKDPLASMAR